MAIGLQNSYLSLPPFLRVPHEAAHVPAPRLIAWNASIAESLGLEGWQHDAAERFSGNHRARFSTPVALAYAGHQFGHFVPQLGDGRALLLGERIDAQGRRFDIQLKGSGRTAFSRGGDGKSPLGPVLREYLVSEGMHHLGVPTTRALAAVTTGETVVRESAQPGAVLARIARSHLRVGSFEYVAARGDLDTLRALIDYAVARHVDDDGQSGGEEPALRLFNHVVVAQAQLVAAWMALGFVHGVMNTDNTTISGETIDYGPCAFLDEFSRAKVFSSIDQHGRYAFDRQATIAAWNLSRLAGCLLLVHDERDAYERGIETFFDVWSARYRELMARRFGQTSFTSGQDDLVEDWLTLLEQHGLDYTLSWHRLSDHLAQEQVNSDDPISAYADRWFGRLVGHADNVPAVRARMAAANPVIIPRNHQIARAIEAAENGDFDPFHELRDVLTRPFDPLLATSAFAEAPLSSQRVTRTFCGT